MKKFLIIFLSVPFFLLASQCKAFFSPNDHLAEELISCIQAEKTSLKVAVYAMTHLGIAKALCEAKARGVEVEVLVDPFTLKSSSLVKKLQSSKVPLFVWDQGLKMKKGKTKSLMHDKFCVFGSKKVWTGSFNFTYAANTGHQENAILIEDEEIAKKYLNQFSQMLLYESRPYQEFLVLKEKKKQEKKVLAKVL